MADFTLYFFNLVDAGYRSFTSTRTERIELGEIHGCDLKKSLAEFGKRKGANKCLFESFHGGSRTTYSVTYYINDREIFDSKLNIVSENNRFVHNSEGMFTINF